MKTKLKTNQININKDIDIIDNMEFLETKISNIYLKFLNEENEYSEIKIFCTEESLSFLNNNKIIQYLIDGTYKILPNIQSINLFVLIIGNIVYAKDNLLCYAILMSDEKEKILIRLLNELKIKYNF